MITKQIQDLQTEELISLLSLNSLPSNFTTDDIIYFKGEPTDPFPYYQRYIENHVNLRWFGAKGNGSIDDSAAFKKAVEFCQKSKYKILLIPEGYIFDLGGQTIDIGEITLHFTGGMIRNAILNAFSSDLYGRTSWIDAGCYRIFGENVTLIGNWASTQGPVWADWCGSVANDYSSIDLKISIEALSKVFKIITLNRGNYYSDKCNIKINSLIGQGVDKTNIDIRPQNDGDYGFLIGNKGAAPNNRTDYNMISNLQVSVGGGQPNLTGTAGIVLGAAHKPFIENVKIQNAEGFATDAKLVDFTNKIATDYHKLNCGLLIDGEGELATINNLMTNSQVGIYYKTAFDFINFKDYTHWGQDHGFSTVFIEKASGANITFTGSQSWSKGLFGLYAMPTAVDANFTNWLIENLRIEQLNQVVDSNGKYIGASIYIGDQMWLNNFIVRNSMLAGTSNGVILNNLGTGFVELDNIKQYFDGHDKKAVQVAFIENTISCINLKNVQLDGSYDLVNAAIVDNSYRLTDFTKDGISQKIISRRNCVRANVNGNLIYKQKESIADGNMNYYSIIQTNPSEWPANQKCKKIDISVVGSNYVYWMKFYYFKDKSFKVVDGSKNAAGEYDIAITSTVFNNKFNVLLENFLFLFNRLNEKVQVFIDHEDLIF